MIDEISMVSSDLWTEIDARLPEIFSISIELPFAGLSMEVHGDGGMEKKWRNGGNLPARRFIFSRLISGSKMNQLLSLQ